VSVTWNKNRDIQFVDSLQVSLEVLQVGTEAAGEEGGYEGLSGLGYDVAVEFLENLKCQSQMTDTV
jgi:hypothetical protein